MARLLLKYATRGRPEWFKSTLKKWYDKLSGQHDIHFIISVDDDDWSMQTPDIQIAMALEGVKVDFFAGPPEGKIKAINRDMEHAGDYDILIVVSDDMIPVQNGYDAIIASDMERYFPNMDGALHYNDGKVGNILITLSIMGKAMYDHFGYIYHPDYKSMWCDNEFMDEVKLLDKYKYLDFVLIKHDWMANGQDVSYKIGEGNFEIDKIMYHKRKKEGFPR